MEESGRFHIKNKFDGLPFVSVLLDVDMMLMSEKPILTAREAIAPLCVATVGRGGTTDVIFFSPRDIVQTALLCNATYVTLLHNHPGRSGSGHYQGNRRNFVPHWFSGRERKSDLPRRQKRGLEKKRAHRTSRRPSP